MIAVKCHAWNAKIKSMQRIEEMNKQNQINLTLNPNTIELLNKFNEEKFKGELKLPQVVRYILAEYLVKDEQ